MYHNEKRYNTGLRIAPIPNNEMPFPKFEEPTPVGFFSVTTQREYEPNANQLRYLKLPKPSDFPLNLNDGLERAIKKPSNEDGLLNLLLKYIVDNKRKFVWPSNEFQSSHRLNADIVCYRGLLRTVMCTPYERLNDWCILATRFKGTLYLCEAMTEQKACARQNETERQKAMSAWGFKFEQYCLTENPFKDPNTSEPVDECAEFSCVFSSKIGSFKLLYGAEMDGIVSEQPVELDMEPALINKLKFVELKTCQQIQTQAQRNTYERHKTRNWWCQSFLVGIEDIYLGLRNESGYIMSIERIALRAVRKSGNRHWSPTVCANFLLEFLTCVNSIMSSIDDPHTTFVFFNNAKSRTITYEMQYGMSADSFLPDWYIQMFNDKSQKPVANLLNV